MSAERDDFRREPPDLHADEYEDYAPRSIFAAGWFRAVLVLTDDPNPPVILTDDVAVSQSWVATLDCRVQTDDPAVLAEFLGRTIGQAVGKHVERKVI